MAGSWDDAEVGTPVSLAAAARIRKMLYMCPADGYCLDCDCSISKPQASSSMNITIARRLLGRAYIVSLASACCFATAANAFSAGEWQSAKAPLMTRWAADVRPDSALPEYPRPQLVRPDWQT